MDSDRKLLRIAGILYGILGVILLIHPSYGIFLIISGVYFFTQANEDEETIYKNRLIHYVLAAFGILNLIGSVLVFIVQDNVSHRRVQSHGMNAPPKVVYKVDKETRKIDLLLKLGVGMVFIAGLLFATTTWNFINDYVKALSLIGLGTFFLFLSLFTEKKLKLYRSSYMYWLLSMSMYVLTIVGILYLGVFGDYLTYSGNGSSLAYAITFLTGAGFALTTYYKFPKKYLLYTCYLGVITSVVFLFQALNFSQMLNIGIISLFVMICNMLSRKKGTLYTFSNILSYLLFAFILTTEPNNDIEVLAACLINIVNLNYLTFIDKKEEENVFNILLTYILILTAFTGFTPLGQCNYLMIGLAVTLYTVLINGHVIPTKPLTAKMNYLAYSILMFGLYYVTIGNKEIAIPSTCVFLACMHLFMNFLVKKGLFRIETWKLANYLAPFIVFNLIDALVGYFGNTMSLPYEFAIVAVVFAIMHAIARKPVDKKILFTYLFITNVIAICLHHTPETIYTSLIVVATCLYQFVVAYLEERPKTLWKLALSYILLLSSLYVPFVLFNILEIYMVYPALVFIILAIIIAPLLGHECIKKISYLYIIFPLLSLIYSTGLMSIYEKILGSITGLYVLLLFIKFFIKDKISKNVILIIGILCCLSQTIFTPELEAGIYVGIVGILIILFTYRKEDLFAVFVTGILLTVFNIIIHLKDIWQVIPFWLYLLIGGLTIVLFVTIRELARQTKSKK